MRPAFRVLVVVVPFLTACVDAPSESTAVSKRIVANRIVANRIVANKLAAEKLAADKIAAQKLTSNSFSVNMNTAGDLLTTADGREVLGAIVACALPPSIMLEATTPEGTFEFFGDVGLVPDWLAVPLSNDGKRWVSACLFSRVSSSDVAISISLRGPNPALATDGDERAEFNLEEGGFFGNYFTAKHEPIDWYACRGADKARGNDGDLANRDCAAPDPQNPGRTLCGFHYAGDCGTFAIARACELFAEGGSFYQRCHTTPITKIPAQGPVFLQVVTTFVLP